MVFQNPDNQIIGTVVEEDVGFGPENMGVPTDDIWKRVNDSLEKVGMTAYRYQSPNKLSGGQKQRVAIGSAIIRKPKAFLMDEPLSNLDAKLRAQMRIELAKLHKELETTVVYVTHDQTEAMTLGSRIVVMKDGVVQQADTPQNVYNSPSNLFVAGFIGSPSMNFLEAWVSVEDGRTVLYPGGSELGKKVYLDGERGELVRQKENGKKVILGIRPEDIYEYEEAVEKGFAQNCQGLEETVVTREMLGAEVILYYESQERTHAVRLSPENQTQVGQKITLYFDTEKIHVFDMETEENLFYREDVQA